MTKERRERERNKQNAESTRYTSPTALFQITRMIAQVKKRETNGTFTFLLYTPSFVSHYFWYFFFFPAKLVWCNKDFFERTMKSAADKRFHVMKCMMKKTKNSMLSRSTESFNHHPNNPCQLFFLLLSFF